MRECDIGSVASSLRRFFFFSFSSAIPWESAGLTFHREGKSTRITPGSEKREILRRDEREEEEKEEEKKEEDYTNAREETR